VFPELKYPRFDIRLKEGGKDKLLVFDAVRRKWLQLTPEEWVRQHVVNYFIHHFNYPASLISLEKEIELNGLKKRYDVVVYTKQLKPFMIVECKAPGVELSPEVLDQASRYNLTLNVEYVFITNGLKDQLYKSGNIASELPAYNEFAGED
jgi:hypothetical protein